MAAIRRKARDILAILVDRDKVNIVPVSSLTANMPWKKIKPALILAYFPQAMPNGIGDTVTRASEFNQYDCDLNEFSEYALVSQIPEPGLVYVSNFNCSEEQGAERLLWAKFHYSNDQQVKDFMNSPAARYVSDPPWTHDVFLAYAGEDEEVANEFHQQLSTAGLTCFTAKAGIGAGDEWTDKLREAIFGCRMGVLLLTPNSFSRPWVMCEAGALWALEKPIVPAYRHVTLAQLPEIITRHQAERIETNREQQDLILKLKKRLYE